MKRGALLVVDLGFGDSGKGTMVDYLVRRYEADLVVRFNGGPQAGHNVVLPDGRHHTFAQFGCGSFVPGVQTLLSRFMLIEPYAMLNEASHLQSLGVSDILSRTVIDERCLVITPPQQIANRIGERARRKDAHGTCGMGIGETVADSLRSADFVVCAADLRDQSLTRKKLQTILEFKRSELDSIREHAKVDELRVLDDPSWIETAVDVYAQVIKKTSILDPEQVEKMIGSAPVSIFEGAQGVLLDERFGFRPHTTWSQTTFTNAIALLDEAQFDGSRQRIGVTRTYLTRHGPGPFVTEDQDLSAVLPEPHNTDAGWQGRLRRGILDLVMLRYAIKSCESIDALAVTHLDVVPKLPPKFCDAYLTEGQRWEDLPSDLNEMESLTRMLWRAEPQYRPFPTKNEDTFVNHLADLLQVPVQYRSAGPTFRDKV